MTAARLQQFFVPGLAGLAAAFGWLVWPYSPLAAVLGSVAIVLGYTALLAAEFAWAWQTNRHTSRSVPGQGAPPLARRREVALAWLREVRVTPQVFGWRQPYRSRAIADALPAGGEGPARCGVVLVHGFFCNRGIWNPWLRQLRAAGHPFIALDLAPVFGSIDDYTPQIDAAVLRMTQATGQPPLLVCHSMGGLAVRAWRNWARARGLHRPVRHIVTIASPHHGSVAAQMAHGVNGSQMRVGNPWLKQLAQQEARLAGDAPPYGDYTCWATPTDNIVFPAASSILAGAQNHWLPARGHVELIFAPPVLARVLVQLETV